MVMKLTRKFTSDGSTSVARIRPNTSLRPRNFRRASGYAAKEHSSSFQNTVNTAISTEFLKNDQIGIAWNTSMKFSKDGAFGQKVGGKAKILPCVEIAVTKVHQNGKTQTTAIAHSTA